MDSDSNDIVDKLVYEEKENIKDLNFFNEKRNIKIDLSFTKIETKNFSEYDLTIGVNPDYSNKLIEMNKVFIVVFPSKRIEVCYIADKKMVNLYNELQENDYIIIEADRGYDCAQIKLIKNENDYKKLLKIDLNNSIVDCKEISNIDISPRKIIRLAYESDIELMKEKQYKESIAFEKCLKGVLDYKYDMKLLCAEYQWDMQKLTFYFSSPQAIDFRELVQELYKHFKVRIWMCSIQKSKNKLLESLFN